jgi:hypothetical protein
LNRDTLPISWIEDAAFFCNQDLYCEVHPPGAKTPNKPVLNPADFASDFTKASAFATELIKIRAHPFIAGLRTEILQKIQNFRTVARR